MRRVVTGHQNGKSVVVHDAEIASEEIPAHSFGGGIKLSEIWETSGIPEIPIEFGDYKTQLPFRFAEAGETRAMLTWLPPDKEVLKQAEEQGIDLFKAYRDRMGDEWGMHTSDTVDINMILIGELWMELDDGAEVQLKQGDCVIQNGTRHAWRNKSTETCILASFSIGANRKK